LAETEETLEVHAMMMAQTGSIQGRKEQLERQEQHSWKKLEQH